MKFTFIFFVTLFLLAACKKDSNSTPIEIQKFYQDNIVKNVKEARLYTRDGIVSNSIITAAYKNEFDNYLLREGYNFVDADFKLFRYISEDSLYVTGVPLPTGLKRVQTGTYDIFANGYKDIVGDTASILESIQRYKRYQPKIGLNGSTYFETDLRPYILKKRNDTLFFSMVRYVAVFRQPGFASFSTSFFNNVFNPAGTARLGTDTLLLQEFELALAKR